MGTCHNICNRIKIFGDIFLVIEFRDAILKRGPWIMKEKSYIYCALLLIWIFNQIAGNECSTSLFWKVQRLLSLVLLWCLYYSSSFNSDLVLWWQWWYGSSIIKFQLGPKFSYLYHGESFGNLHQQPPKIAKFITLEILPHVQNF